VDIFFDERREAVLPETPRDETLGRLHTGGLVTLGPAEGEEPSQVLVFEESLWWKRSVFFPLLLVDLDAGSLQCLGKLVAPALVLLFCFISVRGFFGGLNRRQDLGFDHLVCLFFLLDDFSSFS